jgi:hypothetical protein
MQLVLSQNSEPALKLKRLADFDDDGVLCVLGILLAPH